MSRCKLEEFISYEQPSKYIVDSDQYDDSFEIPVLTAGKSFILGYTDETNNIFDNLPVIIFDDFTTSVQFVDFPFKVKSSAMKLLKNTEQADIKYCYYLLKFLQHTPENHKRQWLSATSQNIVELPTIEKQKNIVRKLDKILEVIDNQNKQLELLDEAIKARFVEMFGDPRINDKKWKTGKIVDYFEVKGGKRIPKGMGYAERKTNHPYLRASDMKNATILDDDIHYIDEEVYKRIKRYTVNAHDIYLTNVGVNLGMAGVIPKKYDGANLTENAVKLVPKDKILLNGMFLSYYINSPGIQHYINERKMSVGVPKLAIFRIESMPLLLPPLELQNQFASFVEEIDKSRLLSNHSLFLIKSITF